LSVDRQFIFFFHFGGNMKETVNNFLEVVRMIRVIGSDSSELISIVTLAECTFSRILQGEDPSPEFSPLAIASALLREARSCLDSKNSELVRALFALVHELKENHRQQFESGIRCAEEV
jgi:hypothetical protein